MNRSALPEKLGRLLSQTGPYSRRCLERCSGVGVVDPRRQKGRSVELGLFHYRQGLPAAATHECQTAYRGGQDLAEDDDEYSSFKHSTATDQVYIEAARVYI